MQKITQDRIDSVIAFLQNAVHKKGFKKVVLGLSGGIDSAVVALLCKKAFASKALDNKSIESNDALKVLLMPSINSSKASVLDSIELCKSFNIAYEIHELKAFEEAFLAKYSDCSPLERGNFCARMRMNLLYFISQKERRLVIGTSNKSEIMLGYGTIFGDLACAINPIANFYKTQIYEIASLLGVIDSIIKKPPSADLYEGQSDEKDLGYSYDEIDRFLESYEAVNGDISKLGSYPKEMVNKLHNRIVANSFKREMPEFFMF